MAKWFSMLPLLFGVANAADIGPGKWQVTYIKGCEVPNPKFLTELSQKKVNRTHDVISGKLTYKEDLDERFGIRVDICKECDGGCKPYQVVSDKSIINFINTFIKGNVEACFANSGIDPPQVPLKKGQYDILDYVYDYDEMPLNGPYGSFIGQAFITEMLTEVGCLELHAEFKKEDEEE